MIRFAELTDIPAIYGVIHRAYARSRFADMGEIVPGAVEALWARLIQKHGGTGAGASWALVSEHNHQVRGIFAAMLSRVYSIGSKLNATDLFFLIEPDGDHRDWTIMVDTYTAWCDSCPDVVQVRIATNDAFSDPRVGDLLERKGFRKAGAIYQRGDSR